MIEGPEFDILNSNEEPTEFDDVAIDKLEHYVYGLIDPRTKKPFYVGKGTGNRVFSHAQRNITTSDEDILPLRLDTISEIRAAGMKVGHVIFRHGLCENAALLVESVLIDVYPNLTNRVRGHHANTHGIMTTREISVKYRLPTLEEDPKHKLLLINIPRLENRFDENSVYNQVRYCWPINLKRAAMADYVLAVFKGSVVGAYCEIEWLPAIRENFPELNRPEDFVAGRTGFRGKKAPPEIWDHYVGKCGKRIEQKDLKHALQNPLRYWGC